MRLTGRFCGSLYQLRKERQRRKTELAPVGFSVILTRIFTDKLSDFLLKN